MLECRIYFFIQALTHHGHHRSNENATRGHSIRIILPVIKSDYKLNEAEKRLINILTDSGSMTRNEVEKAAEMEKSKTIRILNGLIDKNIIQKKGMGRATKYELK